MAEDLRPCRGRLSLRQAEEVRHVVVDPVRGNRGRRFWFVARTSCSGIWTAFSDTRQPFLSAAPTGPPLLPDFAAAGAHFPATLADVARRLARGTDFHGITAEILLPGPFSDAMTHVGQLAMLRRLAGSPVPAKNFVFAAIIPANLGVDQPLPVRPDKDWPERL